MQGGAVSILCGLDRPDYFSGIILISPCVTPEQDTVGPIRVNVRISTVEMSEWTLMNCQNEQWWIVRMSDDEMSAE